MFVNGLPIRFTFKNDWRNMLESGKSFLHNQVRIMVGTLVNVGQGKIEAEKVKEILDEV